ncbi:MAG: HAMP domain-containing sensor histidine kinase, partial [Bacteroidota bacterium]
QFGFYYIKIDLAELHKTEENWSKVIEILEPWPSETDMTYNLERSELLKEAYAQLGNYEKAYEHQGIARQIQDSTLNEKQIKELTKLESEHAFDKERKQMQFENELLEEEKAQQRIVLLASLAGLAAVLLIAFLFYRQNRLRKKANAALAQKNEEISMQNEEIEQQNEKLIDLSRFKEQMTGMIVHDLKSPLNTVLFATRDHADRQLRSAHQASQRMLLLVMNMLDVQKFNDTEVRLNIQHQNVSQLFSEAIKQVAFSAELKKIQFVTEPNDLAIQMDVDLMTRVLTNLLTNAIKYSNQDSQVFLSAQKQPDGKVQLSVRDTGAGIPEKQQAKVFEQFVQTDARKGSTGIGLTFCKLIVEAHGGTIGVNSEVGKESTFWFTLSEGNLQEESTKTSLGGSAELSTEEKAQLSPVLSELRQLDVYEAGEIDRLLADIDFTKSDSLRAWRQALDQAVIECDEEEYERLVSI